MRENCLHIYIESDGLAVINVSSQNFKKNKNKIHSQQDQQILGSTYVQPYSFGMLNIHGIFQAKGKL